MAKPGIILFDGVCNLCNGTVRFVLKYDKQKRYVFTALQSPQGQNLLTRYDIPIRDHLQSFVLYENNRLYTQSTAALKVLKGLGLPWSVGYIFILVPSFIRDAVYKWVARNRYKWFGKRSNCMVPDKSIQERFLK